MWNICLHSVWMRKYKPTVYSCRPVFLLMYSNKRYWLYGTRAFLGPGVTDRPWNQYNWAPCHITFCLFCSGQFVMFWFHCMSIKMIIWISTEVCKTQLLLVDENVNHNKHLHLHIMHFYSWHVIYRLWW